MILVDDSVDYQGTFTEAAGLINPRPPSRAGSGASSFRVLSPEGDGPVSAGMKRD